MQVVENIALISINATLIVQLVSFLLFLAIFNRVMVRPLRKAINDRNLHIQKIADAIQSADAALTDIIRQIETQESQVRDAAFAIQHRIEREGQHQADEIIGQTRETIMEIRQNAQRENAAKIDAIRQQIASEAGPIADRMIAVLLERRSTS